MVPVLGRRREILRLGLGLALGLLALACGREPAVPGRTVPEPTAALRPPEARGEVPDAAHVVDYTIAARFEPDARTIHGTETIVWRNRTEHATGTIPMHLYMNGFRAEDTHWMLQGRGTHRGTSQGRDAPWGYCDVIAVRRVPGGSASPTTLSWSEGEDPSVMEVALDAPVPPGESVTLEVEFVTLLPRVFARTGVYGDFVLAGQWFPKVAVLEPDGRWKNHVFSFHSEFYADFGDYDVTLDVPHGLVVGATGIEVESHDDGDRRILRYRAQMVHDFAWTAWPEFEQWDREHEGIRIRMLAASDRGDEVDLHFDAQVAALDSMQARFGPYPWSTITIVLPPPGAGGAMGMEYPTFYTTTPARDLPPIAAHLGFDHRLGTFTTIHEFGHQYFQGLLASNEYEQPWLDEGMNTFANALALADQAGGGDAVLAHLAGTPITMTEFATIERMRGEDGYPIDIDADAFAPWTGLYGRVVYRNTAALMGTLRNLAGPEVFDRALRTYADRYRFAHPTGEDLERVLLEEIGPRVVLARGAQEPLQTADVVLDVAEALEQGLRTSRTAAFSVLSVSNRPLPGTGGYHRDEGGDLLGGDPPDWRAVEEREDSAVEGVVMLHRDGDFVIPVEIEVEFADGTTTRLWWDGRSRLRELRWPGRRVTLARVDPYRRLSIEADRRDNHRAATPIAADSIPVQDMGELGMAAALALMVGVFP